MPDSRFSSILALAAIVSPAASPAERPADDTAADTPAHVASDMPSDMATVKACNAAAALRPLGPAAAAQCSEAYERLIAHFGGYAEYRAAVAASR
jgi:hypothetical protein